MASPQPAAPGPSPAETGHDHHPNLAPSGLETPRQPPNRPGGPSNKQSKPSAHPRADPLPRPLRTPDQAPPEITPFDTSHLGDPGTLILDEPVNGLDPDAVQWVRQLVRALAAEGRTVCLSSHLMSEMSQTADHLLVIGRGRIIAAGPVQQVIDPVAGQGCLASLVNGGGVAVVDVGFWRADVINGALLKEVPGTGFEVNQAFLVFITIYILIPSLMVIVSLLAPAKINRTTNIIASVIYAVSVVLSLIGETWIYYILGSAVEVILLLVIARTAWTWPRRPAAATGRSPLMAPEPWRTRVTHVRPQIEPSYLERDEQDEFN